MRDSERPMESVKILLDAKRGQNDLLDVQITIGVIMKLSKRSCNSHIVSIILIACWKPDATAPSASQCSQVPKPTSTFQEPD